MFSPVYAGTRIRQHVTFLLSLTLQCVVVALLYLLPPPRMHAPALRTEDVRSTATPVYFRQLTNFSVATSAPSTSKPAPAIELPSTAEPIAGAKPVEPQAEVAKSETGTTAAATEQASGNGEGVAPFPGWQMNSGSDGHAFMHHQVKEALPIFTPDPPILHSEVPESVRGKDEVMNVLINEDGSIVKIDVVQGVGGDVEKAIVDTLWRWIYVPAKINGMPIDSQQKVHFHFPG
jgi:hypothetical protein